MKRICRRCERNTVNRPRGLCRTCYYTPGVKDLYPSTSKHASKANRPGIGVGNQKRPLPETPTSATPGSEEKIEVLQQRLERGEHLYHPNDGTGVGTARHTYNGGIHKGPRAAKRMEGSQ